ncbi:Gfo/Idh/MocA family protein [Flavihumibacter stibioxidans]|uniref:Oxidoreductase n=1 Tax=Flavihumibacter stibioxidans TaxID=1834163 RepID=A0ABR7M3Z4_9BACT|nr:Gfo/Idh/MocA family oxidoreductase [Flavihumibacter stibioxidans]MBC6489366.1 oxidoreductase [Flavihumibacter stibioxidans]
MPYRFAIIGCGQIGQRHAIHAANYGQLVAVCDIVNEKAAAIAYKYGAQMYSDPDQLLKDGNFDIAVICTPNGLHASQSIAALSAGYHVLCEKPMALLPEDGRQMLLAAEKNGKRLFVVKQNRFNSPVLLVKDLLDRNALGRIHSFQLNAFWNRDATYFKSAPWRGTLSLDGGPLFTQFSHFIDLLYWFLGDLSSVLYASGRNVQHEGLIDFEDEGMAVLAFRNDVRGTLQYNLNANGSNMEGSLTLFGERGTVKIGGSYLNKIEHFAVDGMVMPELTPSGAANDYGAYQGSMGNHHLVYEALVRTLDDPAQYFMDPKESLKTVEIITNIYHVMRSVEGIRK